MYSFTGASRPRPHINLGGRSTATKPSDLLRLAKDERSKRDYLKRQLAAVLTIQAYWRSRKAAFKTKQELRSQFDHLITLQNANNHITLSRLILVFFTLTDTSDHSRLLQWANLINSHPTDNDQAWRRTILPIEARNMLNLAVSYPRSEHCLPLLQALNQILGNSHNPSLLLILRSAGRYDYWRSLRTHILAFDPSEKKSNQTVSLALSLSLFPLKLNMPQQQDFLASFATHIFTIPMLANRLDLSTLVDFSSALPLTQLLDILPHTITDSIEQAIHLLANLLTWGSKHLNKMTSTSLAHYLRVIRLCVDIIPAELFARVNAHLANQLPTTSTRASDPNGIGVTQLDPFTPSSSSPAESTSARAQLVRSINPKTLSWISTLISPDHLSKLCLLSTNSLSVCRPVFCQTLVSILSGWPSVRDKIFNALISATSTGGPGSGGVNGFMRELWRHAVRGGKVEVMLRDRTSGGSPQGVLMALRDPKLVGQWEDLIVLSELYSRCLMTLSDDEFFNDETKLFTSSSHQHNKDVISAGRNPLLLGEVVGLAGLLRNLAFGLYWTEGQADIKQGFVVGTRVGLEQFRNLATRLLQQIYVRDSRRRFCQADFWLMTSTFDLESFIQTVVYEESHLEEIRDESNQESSTFPDLYGSTNTDLSDHPARPSGSGHAHERVSKRQLAFISPRLGVLNNIPFVIPFEQRVAIFRTFVQSDKRRDMAYSMLPHESKHRAIVRRDHVAEDGFLHLNALGPRLKKQVEIKFIDQHGLEEAGIDGGGVFKEFLTSLTKLIFDSNKGLWLVNENMELYPNPHSYSAEPLSLQWYAFLGRVLGKALYEGILIDVDFANFFLNKWLGKQSYLDDLASLDPELYQGLLFLKNYRGDVESDLSLNFTITSQEFGLSRTVELIPNGALIPVTNQNRINYIYLISNYKLNLQFEAQSAAFLKGLNDIVEAKWLSMFNAVELKVLVGGLDGQELDFEDLRRWTVYGGWDEAHETIRMFWRVVENFDNATKAALLKFVTSCSRPPLLGFKELKPCFAIRCAGNDESRLPSASTCVNLLKLPEYSSEVILKEKLVYAIFSGAGFDLS